MTMKMIHCGGNDNKDAKNGHYDDNDTNQADEGMTIMTIRNKKQS